MYSSHTGNIQIQEVPYRHRTTTTDDSEESPDFTIGKSKSIGLYSTSYPDCEKIVSVIELYVMISAIL